MLSNKLSVVMTGVTGLVGSETLNQLLNHHQVSRVTTLSRRRLNIEHPKLQSYIDPNLVFPKWPNFESNLESYLETHLDTIAEATIGFIGLGTTIKQAGSKAKLREIDVDLVVNSAKQMKTIGVEHLIVVSCIGANANSFSHYLKCKGEMETQVESLNFKRVTFLQPGPLVGSREVTRKDEQFLQWIMKMITPLMIGRLRNYLPIKATTMTKAVLRLIEPSGRNGVTRLTSLDIRTLANKK
ncbi:nucleoside-diphosphate sugar epimerase [Vibrio sp. SS-MA-C1-2]|uniref:nucleoside-diphosphate sugar epimerase n=1 Tax=Vibrio sp. SS-MA-C1-2 TaxID=2908646 RepID=UPI001F288A3D|nr:nucleoside-diphosphate sugar epimerase [Vibrio sp. SS-MA-C1-2]UJF17887.1 nucleoside-diphosphate sugar epimerase [Vibrio sp. SS-MA-C1-2]